MDEILDFAKQRTNEKTEYGDTVEQLVQQFYRS